MISSRTIALTALSAALLCGCSYIHTERLFRPGANEWLMYGGNPGRTNVSAEELSPPLIKMWQYNAGAGLSGYSTAVADSTIFVGTLAGELQLVDIATGKGTGSTDFGSAIAGTPLVDNDIVVIPLAHDDMSLIAYNVRSSKNEWQRNLGDIESSPLLVEEKLLVTTVGGKLYCLDKHTGEELWKFTLPRSNGGNMIHSSPATDGTLVFFGTDSGNVYAVDLGSGKLRWEANAGGTIVSSPSVSGGRVIICSLGKACSSFDAATGALAWRRDLGAPVFSSQAVDGKHVYVGTTGHIFYCLNKDDGSVVWTYTAQTLFNATPLVAGDIVYAGCADKNLYAFNANTGELVWQYKMEGRIKTMPIAWHEYLIVMSEDDVVVGLKGQKR